MKSTIMDNAKSDLVIVKMCIEYYNLFRDKDIKRHACYHIYCSLKKMFIAILINNNKYSYEELVDKDLMNIFSLIDINVYSIPIEIIDNIENIQEWNEDVSIFSFDFRPDMDFVNQIYDITINFFDCIFDQNAVC